MQGPDPQAWYDPFKRGPSGSSLPVRLTRMRQLVALAMVPSRRLPPRSVFYMLTPFAKNRAWSRGDCRGPRIAFFRGRRTSGDPGIFTPRHGAVLPPSRRASQRSDRAASLREDLTRRLVRQEAGARGGTGVVRQTPPLSWIIYLAPHSVMATRWHPLRDVAWGAALGTKHG